MASDYKVCIMKITVFTPTYNRAYIIEKLYRSLQRQTVKDFEWLVVDDGSSDDTRALLESWQKEDNLFPIRYYYKENGGKHRAINYALDLAQGELFFTVDSDDYLTDDALEKVASWAESISGEAGFCGVAGNLGTNPGVTPNTLVNGPYWDGDLLARYAEAGRDVTIDGERALVFYTEVHRKYRYPEIDGEKFITEAVAWNRMAKDGWKVRFFNDVIWIYEYMPDGLTKAGFKLFANNPKGYILWRRELTGFLTPGFWNRRKCGYNLYCDLRKYYPQKQLASMLGWDAWLAAAVFWLKNGSKGRKH